MSLFFEHVRHCGGLLICLRTMRSPAGSHYDRTGRNNRMGDVREGDVRSFQLDLMRTAAICAVVLIHVWGPSTEVTRDRWPLHAAFFAVFVSGSVWAVPCFFFVSGLLLTQRSKPYTWPERLTWLRKRAVRLLPPYVFWSVATLAVTGPTNPPVWLRSLLLGNASYHMYFVVALVQMYLLWLLFMPWVRKQTWDMQRTILICVFALSAMAHVFRAIYLTESPVDQLNWLRATAIPWVGYFALGCLGALWQQRTVGGETCGISETLHGLQVGRCRTTLLAALIALACLALMVTGRVTYRGPHFDDPVNTLLKPAYSVAMIWVIAAIAQWWMEHGMPCSKGISALARDSYGIYLSHVLVMQLLSGYLSVQLPGLDLPTEAGYRIIAWIATMSLSWAIVRLLSMLPGIRWCSGAQVS